MLPADRPRPPGPPLIAVSAVWGVFWGAWAGLLPAVKDQVGATIGNLGVALVAVPVGAIPAMALTGRLARGRERRALATVTVAFAAAVAALATASSPVALGGVLALVGMTSGAVGGGLGIVSAALLPTAALTLTCLVITGLAFGPLMPALFSYVARFDRDGSVVAVVTTTSYSGFPLSPLLVATLTGVTALPGAVACLGVLALPLLGAAVGGRFPPPAGTAQLPAGSGDRVTT